VNNLPKVATLQWNGRESNLLPHESEATALPLTIMPPGHPTVMIHTGLVYQSVVVVCCQGSILRSILWPSIELMK